MKQMFSSLEVYMNHYPLGQQNCLLTNGGVVWWPHR